MAIRSYSEIRDQIDRDLADLTLPDARKYLIEQLAELRFEVNRVKEYQRTLLAALRARDILVREHPHTEQPRPAVSIDLDLRDVVDAADGFHDVEWDEDVALRWTGPGHDTVIRAWLDRSIPTLFEIELVSYGDKRNRGTVALSVDGAPVAIKEIRDKRLRSDQLPVIGASLYTEIGIHVPWLTGPAASAEHDARANRQPGGGRHGRRSRTSRAGDGDERIRGIAVSRMRFLSLTDAQTRRVPGAGEIDLNATNDR
jgi:hypothetical protein